MKNGTIDVLADRYAGNRLNSPNDVLVTLDGSVVFTDPTYGLRDAPGEKELDMQGVYRVPPQGGDVELLTADLTQPNGLVASPDGRRLFVSDSAHSQIRVFEIGEDWRLSGGEVLVQLPQGEGVEEVDGMTVDEKGNLFCAGPGGVWICAPSGAVLGLVRTPEFTSNVTWGEPDRQTLYLTVTSRLCRIRCETTGCPR